MMKRQGQAGGRCALLGTSTIVSSGRRATARGPGTRDWIRMQVARSDDAALADRVEVVLYAVFGDAKRRSRT